MLKDIHPRKKIKIEMKIKGTQIEIEMKIKGTQIKIEMKIKGTQRRNMYNVSI